MSEHPECPFCICGLVEVEWSDRRGTYNPKDPNSVVEVVLACALDHSYDRTNNGIPYGMGDTLVKPLAAVLNKWFTLHHPEWFNKTVYLEDYERENLKADLLRSLA